MIILKIVKIIIKSKSGYGPEEHEYKDKIMLTEDSISYDFIPQCVSGNLKEQKWIYRTNSPVFEKLFYEICEIIPKYIDSNEILFCDDIGPTDFTVIYDDKSRRTEHFFCPSEYFRELFVLIRKIIPPCECIPISLLLDEDEFEDLPFC